MNNTGRIQSPPQSYIRRVLFCSSSQLAVLENLRKSVDVDRAHLVMLSESGIAEREKVAQLLRAIDRLADDDFAPLHDTEPVRGTYLQYEDYLIRTEGAAIGGILQIGRSRNDLNATVMKLLLRMPYARAVVVTLRLMRHLLLQAEKYAATLMPAYTHGQPATPGSYGHYLAGVARAVSRDLEGVLDAARDLENSPLGAGAVSGSHLPLDCDRTAVLLGFRSGPVHSQDAVASRDCILRLLAALSIAGVTLSRIASDLMRWTGPECDFLRLPDSLVGSSSAMPQKRNPFVLEHVLGRVSTMLGAFVSGAQAMHATPFSNCIAVGTEAPRPLWQAMEDYTHAVELLRRVMISAVPNPPAMTRAAQQSFVIAQALATEISRTDGLDFRTAHRIVGECISAATASDHPNQIDGERVLHSLRARGLHFAPQFTDPAAVMEMSEWGGGPGQESMRRVLSVCRREWKLHRSRLLEQRTRWKSGQRLLRRVVDQTCSEARDSVMAGGVGQ